MAATDLERLVVQLSADLKGYENSMRKAQGVTNQRLGAIQKKALASSTAIAGAFIKSGAAIAGAFIANDVIRNIGQLSDAATRIDNALKVAGLSGAELETVYQRLNKAAIANGAPIETLATLYGKAAQSQKELGVTTEELLGFTNNVALALRVAGTDAQSASGALLQLGQALGSGKVQAEEFNSILEGAPTIAQAAAAGLKEAGGSVSRLKGLVVDGKISSEAFFRAFEAGAPILQSKVAGSVFTIEQAAGNLWTALINVAREFNNSTGASKNFAGGMNTAAKAINGFDVSALIQKVRDARKELDSYLSSLGNAQVFKDLASGLGVLDSDGNVIKLDTSQASGETAILQKEVKLLQDRIALNTSLGFDNTGAIARLDEVLGKLNQVRGAAGSVPAPLGNGLIEPVIGGTNGNMGGPSTRGGARRPVAVAPVSVKDFRPPVGKSGSGKPKTDDLQREIAQIKERTEALQAETAAQAQVNPLIDDYGFAVEKAAAKHDLLKAAQEAGKKVTPELAAQIDTLATSYANAVVASERLAESQDRVRQAAEDAREFNKDLTRGIIDGFVEGKKAADVFADSLKKIGDRLLGMALDSIFDSPGKGGAGFNPLSFLGDIFRASGGPVRKGQPYVVGEKRPELFVPDQNGSIVSRVPTATPTMPSLGNIAPGRSSGMAIDVSVSVDENGNLQAFVNSVAQQKAAGAIRAYDAGGMQRTVNHIQTARKYNAKI
ncbi:tape measure protein [Neorhizobium galegae]|uniref:tape measure protein n=1 Tax=Neorhizobium galegae TaxID=399 RepID=UPI001F1D28E0|nr:tape measure protein [Neorhizobium galegae]UIK05001.1 tape measure protein [Neorhizobium galegae]